jgi:predicted transcriptional regulator
MPSAAAGGALEGLLRPRKPAGPEAMSEEAVGIRNGSDRMSALDAIAARTHRELGRVIDEALSIRLEQHARQLERIEQGMLPADAGKLATDADVRAVRSMPALMVRSTRQAIVKA